LNKKQASYREPATLNLIKKIAGHEQRVTSKGWTF
jgi:hypothetical protein